MVIDVDIKDRLKELREEREFKIYDISKLLGLEKDSYGKYERGNITIPIVHLIKVSSIFDVSIDYIFKLSSVRQYNNNDDIVNVECFALRLREFRKENKLTQSKLAEILNTNQSVIANYERARNLITTSFLYTICKKYKISADYLLGKIDNPKYLK